MRVVRSGVEESLRAARLRPERPRVDRSRGTEPLWVDEPSWVKGTLSPAEIAPRAMTPEQEHAVARRSGPLLLAAAAGSGKTAVIVERFVAAVREDGVAPSRILAITFTERSAGELRARVRRRLLELGEREAARDTEAASIGTFHGFCARLLRVHALQADLDPEFVVLDEAAAGRFALLAFRRALAELLAIDTASERPQRSAAVDLVAAYGADRLRAMLLRAYAEQRSRGIASPALPVATLLASAEHDRDRTAVQACVLLDELLRGFGQQYAELKRARGALDFDDLELCAHELLAGHEDVRSSWSQRLELLMVDEFQDTNRRQLNLLELLDRGNLFTVGDELQSIYGFRYADVELFRKRRASLAERGATLVLALNFRARPALLEAVNAVFATRFGAAYTPLVAAREEDETNETPAVELLLTNKRGWAEVSVQWPLGGDPGQAPAWRRAEARLLALRVAELIARGEAAAGDVVVLLRAAGDLPLYERALQDCGLRTLAATGTFWEHQQVRDLLAWLRALANPLDEIALYGALASPLVGLSSDALALLAIDARKRGVGVWATIQGAGGELHEVLPEADREHLKRFASTFAQERALAAGHSVAELLLRAIAVSGYEAHVRSLSSGERRLANIHKLLRLARRFEAAEGRGLRGFLDYVAHCAESAQGGEPQAPAGVEDRDAVRLMTIHAAKGLEFAVVCLADLGRVGGGTPPDLLCEDERIGLRLVSLDGSEPCVSLDYAELDEERRGAEQAEEERIVYVAMTRARERLLLSGAVDFARWPTQRPGGPPIAWLALALAAEIPQRAAALQRPVFDIALGATQLRCRLSTPETIEEVLDDQDMRPENRIPRVESAAMLVG